MALHRICFKTSHGITEKGKWSNDFKTLKATLDQMQEKDPSLPHWIENDAGRNVYQSTSPIYSSPMHIYGYEY